MDVDTGTLEVYYLWVHWINTYGTYVLSEPILIHIKYNCTYDVITHSIVAPVQNIDYPPTELSFIKDDINNIRPNVHLNFTAGVHDFLRVNVSSRIANNASAYCPLYNYHITKLVNADTG